jgi:NAD(P)H-nitrite reductase large subunit
MEDMNKVICPCFDLTLGVIIKDIKENNVETIEELMEVNEAGTMCGACIDELEEIIEKYKNK